MPVARRGTAAIVLVALLLAPTPLLPGRGADDGRPPPPPAAPLFPAASGSVLLSRVYPNAARDDEFVEIANPGASVADLGGWSLSDLEATATFPPGTVLAPGARLVATRNATSYREDVHRAADLTYDRGDAPRMEGGTLRLGDAGDEVLLLDDTDRIVDAYVYGDSAYAGAGWTGPPAVAPARGEIATRRTDGGAFRDTDGAEDWEGIRAFRLGQSDFHPPSVTLHREPVALVSPDDGRGAVLSFLASAENHLDLAVYTLTSDALTGILSARARDGVRVRVLLEGSPAGGVEDHERCLVAGLLEAGAQVRFLAGGLGIVKRYRYLHAKYALVDGESVLVSSENFGDAGFPPAGQGGNRGWSVILQDLVLAGQLWEVFAEDFDPSRADTRAAVPEGASCLGEPMPVRPWMPPPDASGVAARLVVGPDSALDPDGLLGLLASARHRLWIEAFYAEEMWGETPSPYLEAAFAAARRGVSVRILLDGSDWSLTDPIGSDEGNDAVAARLNARSREEGVDLEARVLAPVGLVERVHNKGVVVDGEAVLVSSLNWAHGSATENREIGVLLQDSASAARFEAAFLQDWDGRPAAPADASLVNDPTTLLAMYAFVGAASALSLRKMRRGNKGLKPEHRMDWRGHLRAHLGGRHRKVRVLPPELVAESRDGAGGGTGDRGGGDEARGGLRGPEGD